MCGGGCKERLAEPYPCLVQDDATKERYTSLKEETLSLKAALEAKEKELEQFAARTRELEEEVAQSEIKQEAGKHYVALHSFVCDVVEGVWRVAACDGRCCASTGHPPLLFLPLYIV